MLGKMPLPMSINYYWNFGSLLGCVYTCQLVSGILLSLRYHASSGDSSFESVENIVREVEHGITVRGLHLAGSQMMMLLIYLHMLRSLMYGRGVNTLMTLQGTVILILTMGAAFLGYVLPWGQMSFWGATVITGFLGVLPFGDEILKWVWGGFTVGHPTLVRFFSLHYLLGLAIAPLSLMHVLILHQKGSGSPLGDYSDCYLPFWPYFGIKDSWPVASVFLVLLLLSYTLVPETENMKNANPMSTPTHIKPEWYFLMMYAILRAVPSKVGGLILMGLSIAMFILLMLRGVNFSSSPLKMFYLSNFIGVCFMLGFLGGMPVEEPYLSSSMVMSLIYFGMIGVSMILL
uniref:Cytochrome b n=1 Tax=Pegea confoederata TaxID=942563 RepID=A0AA86IKG9_9UROC|nr:cytochrome b [Pegea confoederata]